MMLGSAIPDILSMSDAVKGMHDALGYPVILFPSSAPPSSWVSSRCPRPWHQGSRNGPMPDWLSTWWAPLFSIIAAGQGPGAWGFMILPLLLAGASYIFYRKKILP